MSKHLTANPPQKVLLLHRQLQAVWQNERGIRGILSSVNHTDMGLRFMITAGFFFGIAGILSMLIRAQLATQEGAFLDVALYNQIFTMHGTLMMFLFATPMFEGLAMYLLPRMLGTRDLAFPRLSALGWWCYFFGGLILLAALASGVAPDGGWFMYTPLSSKTYSPGINADVWLLGITFIEISAIAAAVEITVSILKLRSPGMKLTQMPLMAWYLLAAAVMMLAGFPPLILGSLLLELERAFDWPFFDPLRGGDALLWQHLFWLFGHPEVYIIFLPAAGVVSTVLPVMARTKILGYGTIVAAIVALVFLSFGLWVHHMFTVGIPHMALAFFSASSTLVGVPTAVQIFLWIGTLWKGRPQMSLPMLHLTGFFSTFVMGGLTGIMLAIVPFNWQAHDTAFVTAHLHYVLIGGFVFPMMAGLSYWMPYMTGRLAIPQLGAAAFWLIFIGFHGTFFLMHLTGLMGMPRRIASYAGHPEWEVLNLISSFFGFVMTIGFGLFVLSLILQALFGDRSAQNPWQADGFEWRSPRYRNAYNFASLPLPQQSTLEIARGEGALVGAPRGLREVAVISVIEGEPEFIAVLPKPTMLPLITALSIGVFVLFLLFGFYITAGLWLGVIAAVLWRWGAPIFTWKSDALVPVLPGMLVPMQFTIDKGLPYMGLICLLIANGALFCSYLFGLGFLSIVTPDNTPPLSQLAPQAQIYALLCLALLGAASVAARVKGVIAAFATCAANLGALGCCLILAFMIEDPTLHARFALIAFGLAHVAFHAFVSALLSLRLIVQLKTNVITAHRSGIRAGLRLWQSYSFVTSLLLLSLLWLQGV